MEENKPIPHIAAGAIVGALLIIFSLAILFMDYRESQKIGWLAYIILGGGIILFVYLYGKASGFRKPFGNLFSYGFKMTAIIALIMILFLIVFFEVLPGNKEKMLDLTRQSMEEKGKLTDDQIEKFVEGFKKYFIVLTIGGAMFMYTLIGAVSSLIGAAITKKNPVNPLDQIDL